MNKYIKNKKKNKMLPKKLFSKQELLFLKKFPRLHAICYYNNISYQTINKGWNTVKKIVTKEEYEIAIRVAIAAIDNGYVYRQGTRGEFAMNIFKMSKIKYPNIKPIQM